MKIFSGSPLTPFACAAPMLIASAGCAAAGYPAGGMAGRLPRMVEATPPAARSETDVVIIRENGACTAMARDSWVSAARERIATAVRTAYAELPVNHDALSAEAGDVLLSEESICATMTRPSGATRENHAELRERHTGSALSQEEARARGIAARLFSPRTLCAPGRDWSKAPGFIGVTSCDQVASKVARMGIPITLFAVDIDMTSAQRYLESPEVIPFLMRYTNEGPIPCGGNAGYRDSFHSLYVSPIWSALTFVERAYSTPGFSHCSLLPSCTATGGESYRANDLLFGFGMRVYLQAEVEIDGERKSKTLIAGSTAAASESWLAGLLPKDLPYERYLGSELVKKIVLEAAANGW